MLGLTTIGVVHTAISLVAVAAGIYAFFRDKEISPRNGLGRVYLWTTVLTCLTGFFIFQHGGFGKPHALGIITLLVLALAWVAGSTKLFGRAGRYIETVSYSLTFFFHMIPGFTESLTRLPAGAPVFSGPDDPTLQKVIGVVFLLFLAGAFLQVMRLRRAGGVAVPAT
ncbi:hypothetical protein CSC74_10845 [Pseudoxanthomonas yeongjuensis]|jgi:uncharacterized membrane protein|uniref:hypothetical protein n=1 Tax=Pseudoxanthomonas yeongjuensis TaxID=377616 RepID=UPI00139194AF|nr:hypothetical protein [Pseudoxanthomonas yeongjuensis]KAF1716333.1 hypothetical protein CSC74_10845 [Pseudoxanthomonas yeongjuensis]